MKINDIYIRDPYILFFEDKYYMYGKISLHSTEFVVYESVDLKIWSEPKVVFSPTEDFWGKNDFWAPEVHIYNGKFYMFASFKADDACRGTHILKADAPDGMFVPVSDTPITPRNWEALDGTLYIDKNDEPHIVFSHEWEQIGEGTICEMRLSKDLVTPMSEPRVLWSASDFAGSVNAAEDDRLSLVTDGPYLFRTQKDELYCMWSTIGQNGYMMVLSKSDNGDIDGNWTVIQKPLYDKNGGHGMIFNSKSGEKNLVLHQPNIHPLERANIYIIKETEEGFALERRN